MPRVNDYYQNMPKAKRPAPSGISGGARMPETATMPKRKQAKRRGQMKALGGSAGF